MKPFVVVAVVVLLLRGVCLAQVPKTATELIEASIVNADANAKEALSYTFHEDVANFFGDVSSEPPKPKVPGTEWIIPVYMVSAEYRWSMQYDVLFVEGVPYRRMTGINAQRLEPQIATLESERYDRAVAAIHALSPEQRLQRLRAPQGSASIMMDPKQLISFYDCKISGHEKVEKRPATVIKCKPRRHLSQVDTPTRVSGDVTLWVDDQQPFFRRTRLVLDHTVDQYGAGTVVIFNWSLIDGVWHESSTELDWIGADKTMKNINTSPSPGTQMNIEHVSQGKVVDTFSNFKKFRIESRIVSPDALSTVPPSPQR
jgi:hypothetical protein